MKIAIIGSGISGLGAAYLLSPHHDVHVYEKNAYVGGHSRTIEVQTGDPDREGGKTPVDTGFIVFNNWNYPNLMGLFKQLQVPFQKSRMAFGVSINKGWLEYGSDGLFAQKRNFLRPAYYRMLLDIIKFNKQAPAYIDRNTDMSLQDCLDEMNMGDWFRRYYLLAMGAAIWSCPVETIMQFPAQTFLRFFKNHGLLSLTNRPQWYTVTGGSREYVKRLTSGLKNKIRLNTGVKQVSKDGDTVTVLDSTGVSESYDQVIFACHADETLGMIDKPSNAQKQVLSAFTYQDNQVVVHADISLMPQHKKCWSSWVYLSETQADESSAVALTYWMNNLQGLNPDYPVLVTLNPGRQPDPDLVWDTHSFSHPVFDAGAVKAQADITHIQGKDLMWFCGAYQRYGFHEDGLLSAVNVVKGMGIEVPWD